MLNGNLLIKVSKYTEEQNKLAFTSMRYIQTTL